MNTLTLYTLQVRGLSMVDRYRCRNNDCNEWDIAVYVNQDFVHDNWIKCRSCNSTMTNFGGPNYSRADIGNYIKVPIRPTTT